MNYADLVRNKRKKMLCLVLLLIFCPFFTVSGINLTYIVKKDNDVIHPSCIAEELERYAAIGWVYLIPNKAEDVLNITTKFIPDIENSYNCKFSKHNLCNVRWALKDWKIDENSSRTRDPLFDNRWEDLPTILISNTTKEFNERVDFDNIPKLVFSVRADGIVELFFCAGWNPYNYPCYYFNINYKEVIFKTYPVLPKDIGEEYKMTNLQLYRGQTNILSHDEWRTFSVEFNPDGLVTLRNLNLNRTLIEKVVENPVTPLYMFMRGGNSSLWKIHQNHFLYTNTTQISRLGPQVTLFNKDLCISMLISTCNTCAMNFFYLNGTTKKMLKNVGPIKDNNWVEIKIKQENIQIEYLNIFVQTMYTQGSEKETGFWAIDNVRICNENEVKVTFLETNKTLSEEDISCQVIKHPNWRPKKYVYEKIREFPQITQDVNKTSISLSWAQEDPSNLISYFITYQGVDQCPLESYNLKRVKSNGFVSTKFNEVFLENLVPFTRYNITISTVLHETDMKLFLTTPETEEPLSEELPSKIQVKPQARSVKVSWEPVDCASKYGPLLYTITVTDNRNFTEEKTVQTDVSYEIGGLEPFKQYTLKVLTARSGQNIHDNLYTSSFVINFTTSAGDAPPPENLELYSIDGRSAALRYEFPDMYRGIIREVQVKRCLKPSASKCKSAFYPIRRCPFWPRKYCVDVNNLISNNLYAFSVSLKTFNTASFGKEETVDGYSRERVPGQPTNVTYKFVDCQITNDYCHLNVTWFHPYDQNSSIDSFDLILETVEKHKNSEDDKRIHEVYRIENSTYYSYYTYQIKYIPYSTYYNLSLRSVNKAYVSDFTNVTLKTDNIGDHIDQNPKLIGESERSLIFKVPHLDRRLDFYTLTVVVQDFNITKNVSGDIVNNRKISKNLCHGYGNTWLSQIIKVTGNNTDNIMIGGEGKKRLKPNTKYCVTFIVTNNYKGSDHDVVYYEKLRTSGAVQPPEAPSSSQFNPLYLLLLLLLFIPLIYLGYRYLRKRRPTSKPAQNLENVYETLPFDECDMNCVENETYNKLNHK